MKTLLKFSLALALVVLSPCRSDAATTYSVSGITSFTFAGVNYGLANAIYTNATAQITNDASGVYTNFVLVATNGSGFVLSWQAYSNNTQTASGKIAPANPSKDSFSLFSSVYSILGRNSWKLSGSPGVWNITVMDVTPQTNAVTPPTNNVTVGTNGFGVKIQSLPQALTVSTNDDFVLNASTNGTNWVTERVSAGVVKSFLGGGGASATNGVGIVATRGCVAYQQAPTNFKICSRSYHIAKDNLTNVALLFGNFFNNASNTAPEYITASVEYPSNVLTRVTFGGAGSTNLAGGAVCKSDFITLSNVIPSGAVFWVRMFTTNDSATGSGAIYEFVPQPFSMYPYYEGGNLGNAGVLDYTGSNGVVSTLFPASSYIAQPVAIIAATAAKSVFVTGNSRTVPAGDSNDTNCGCMGFERLTTPYGDTVWGCPGESFTTVLATPWQLAAQRFISQYASAALVDFNITSDTESAVLMAGKFYQIVTNLVCPVWTTTAEPTTTSSDNWTTYTGQTLDANNANRVAWNKLVRNRQLVGMTNFIDLAAVGEYGTDTGLIQVNGSAGYYTGDGLHYNSTFYKNVAAYTVDFFTPKAIVPNAMQNGTGLANGNFSQITVTNFILDRTTLDYIGNEISSFHHNPGPDGTPFCAGSALNNNAFTCYMDVIVPSATTNAILALYLNSSLTNNTVTNTVYNFFADDKNNSGNTSFSQNFVFTNYHQIFYLTNTWPDTNGYLKRVRINSTGGGSAGNVAYELIKVTARMNGSKGINY